MKNISKNIRKKALTIAITVLVTVGIVVAGFLVFGSGNAIIQNETTQDKPIMGYESSDGIEVIDGEIFRNSIRPMEDNAFNMGDVSYRWKEGHFVELNAVNILGTSIFFSSASISGNLDVDGGTLYVDAGADMVGIGTTGPASLLHLQSATPWLYIHHNSATINDEIGIDFGATGTNKIARITAVGTATYGGNLHFETSVNDGAYQKRLTILEGGNVGIGTTNPIASLEISGGGNALFLVDSTDSRMVIGDTTDASDYGELIWNTTGSYLGIDADLARALVLQKDGGNVGIGADTSPEAMLEILDDDSETMLFAITSSSDGDYFVVKNTGNVGIGDTDPQFTLSVDGTASISDDFYVGDTAFFVEASSGKIFMNETTNANSGMGLTIYQGASDDEIISLKSSDVGHSLTDLTEADTYGFLRKIDGSLGGLDVVGVSDGDAIGLVLQGTIGAADPTDSISAVVLRARKFNMTMGVADLANAETILSVQNGVTDKFTILGDGTVVARHFIPAATNTYDLGSPTARWQAIYVSSGSFHIGNASIKNINGELVFVDKKGERSLDEIRHLGQVFGVLDEETGECYIPEELEVKKITTDELCVGKTCMTEEELKGLLDYKKKNFWQRLFGL